MIINAFNENNLRMVIVPTSKSLDDIGLPSGYKVIALNFEQVKLHDENCNLSIVSHDSFSPVKTGDTVPVWS